MILFHKLPEKIAQQFEVIELLYAYREESITIYGDTEERKNTKIDYYLHKVTIHDLPKENIWVFEAETTKAKCLSAGSKIVERCLLYLNDKKLYLFMIELKSKISDCKKLREKVKDKFECTLERLIIYLASNPAFSKIEDLELIPVGVLCFNKDEYDINQGGTSLICQSFVKFKQTKNVY